MDELHHVSGLMSGSSLDGVDLAYCSFGRMLNAWEHRILEAETIAYPPELKETLFSAEGLGKKEVLNLDME